MAELNEKEELELLIFNFYKKKYGQLVLTGGSSNAFFWRDNEIAYGSFSSLNEEKKDEHLSYLISLGEENRGTNDDYILKFFGPEHIKNNIHYFNVHQNDLLKKLIIKYKNDTMYEKEEISINVEEISTNVEEISTKVEEIIVPEPDDLLFYGKEYLEEYLNTIFEIQNPRWQSELLFTTAEKFIEYAQNYMDINDLTISHIRAYKLL